MYCVHRVLHTPSTAYTEYCIHRVLHTPSTAYRTYCNHRALDILSTAYTKYCIHQGLHTPSTACTENCIIRRSTVSSSQPVFHHSSFHRHCCTQLSTFPPFQVNQRLQSQLPLRLPLDRLPRYQLPPTTPPMLLDHGLQVCMIMASKQISNLAWSWLASISWSSLAYSLVKWQSGKTASPSSRQGWNL